jgi:hypothetical protein
MPDSVSSSVWIAFSCLRRGGRGVRFGVLSFRRTRGVLNWGGGEVCVARDTFVVVGEGGRNEGFKSCRRDSIASAR